MEDNRDKYSMSSMASEGKNKEEQMIAAGKTINDFVLSGACKDQCAKIIDKVTIYACSQVGGEFVVDVDKAKEKYEAFVELVGAPADGNYDNFGDDCKAYFLELPELPDVKTAGHAKVYAAGGVTASDVATFNALMSKKDKTAEECAADEKIPDGKGECKSCPDGTEFKNAADGCVKEEEGPSIFSFAILGGMGFALGKGYEVNSSISVGDDFGDLSVSEDTSDQLFSGSFTLEGRFNVLDPKDSKIDYDGMFIAVGLNVFGTLFDEIVESGSTTKDYHSVTNATVHAGLGGAIPITEKNLIELEGAGHFGGSWVELVTADGSIKDSWWGVFAGARLAYKRILGDNDAAVSVGAGYRQRLNFINPMKYRNVNDEEGSDKSTGRLKIPGLIELILGIEF